MGGAFACVPRIRDDANDIRHVNFARCIRPATSGAGISPDINIRTLSG